MTWWWDKSQTFVKDTLCLSPSALWDSASPGYLCKLGAQLLLSQVQRGWIQQRRRAGKQLKLNTHMFGDVCWLFLIFVFGSENGKFKSPKGVAVDRDGYIIVADSGNHRIQVFRPDGSFLCKFGTKGRNEGQFKDPEGVALTSDGKIVVSDKENYRLQYFWRG